VSLDVEPFQAIAISRLAHSLEMQGRSVIHLEFGQPSAGAPRKAIAAAQRVLGADPLGYCESPALKSRLARHYRDTYGIEVDPDRFVLTCGASPALVLALASQCAPGDRIALARPGYVAYRNTVKALHLSPVEIACGPESRYQLTASRIARIDPTPKGLIVASPTNPTGTIISPPELAQIAGVCRDRGIRIISDEVYHGLSFGEPTRSMLEFDPEATVVGSFSKYFSMPGWRLGWILAPARDLTRVRAYAGNMFLSAPSISQHAALAALDSRDELEGHIEVYRRNRDVLLAAMPRLGLGEPAPPDGAFYLYIDIRHLTSDSLTFCRKLLQDTGVAMAPGVDFDPIDGGHFVRMSFAVSTTQVEDAVARLAPWLRRLTSSPG
jgi:aspartate/methionine/tyrosine aminotransferase